MQEAQDTESHSVTHAGCTYVWHNCLLFRVLTRCNHLCVPNSPDLHSTVLKELHTTLLGGHFRHDKMVELASC